jgi:hypothetical protein
MEDKYKKKCEEADDVEFRAVVTASGGCRGYGGGAWGWDAGLRSWRKGEIS